MDARWRPTVALVALVALVPATSACGTSGHDGRVEVVAAFYPLAWAAREVGGNRVDVEDLTPPGTEAHDTTLTAAQRGDLSTAALVVYLGDLGFQPDVERAVQDAQGRVVAVADGLQLLPSTEGDLTADPHVWLDPVLMDRIVRRVADGLVAADPGHETGYRDREEATLSLLGSIDEAYREALEGCAFTTFVTTHQAFGYLAARYGLHELGIEGLTPESEPSADRIEQASSAIEQKGAAPAVFYEATDEGRRVGQSVAADVGVPAIPLGTLESEPSSGDYPSVMRANLAGLQGGLRCGR
ncbi:MAG: metal ABC transporter substrate-binding protein [Candidatus Velamenicoccus archaeovorus]